MLSATFLVAESIVFFGWVSLTGTTRVLGSGRHWVGRLGLLSRRCPWESGRIPSLCLCRAVDRVGLCLSLEIRAALGRLHVHVRFFLGRMPAGGLQGCVT